MSKAEKLQKVFDTQTLQGKLVQLNTEQADTFVDYVANESKLLGATRVVKMDRPNKTIAKLYSNGRFLHPGTSWALLDSSKRATASSDTVELSTDMVRGEIFMTDEEIEDNIEGENFKATFMSLIAKKVANELEEISIYSRKVTDVKADQKSTLDQFNGFKFKLLQAGNVVRASDTTLFADRLVAKAKFAKAMKTLQTKYRNNIQYLTPSDVMIDYGLLFDTVADSQVRAELKSMILNKPLIEVPLMKVDEPVIKTAWATDVNGAVTANGTTNQITVTDGSWIAVGKDIVINYWLVSEKVYTVTAKSTHVLTLDRPIEYNIADEATVHVADLDGADVILGNPKNFIYGIQTGDGAIQFETERVAGIGFKYHFKMRMDFQVENPEAATLLTDLKVA